jgi:FkbM family methyltransferase
MSFYWNNAFLKHLNIDEIKIIFEAGARYGEESIKLSETFKNSKIYSFECNPDTIDICEKNLEKFNNINFYNFGLGEINSNKPFFSYKKDNYHGPSSFLQRYDFSDTQIYNGEVRLVKLNDFVKKENITQIDLLCMDVQGYELNILMGAGEFIKKIKYIILEQPNEITNLNYLNHGNHSNYKGAPDANTIKNFMTKNNFIEIERLPENHIENNVMYKNILFDN